MTFGIWVLFVNRSGQHLDGTEEERMVLFSRFAQVKDVALQVVGHAVERLRQFADLCAALYVHTLGEVAAGNGAARCGQHLQWSSKFARSEESYEDTEGNGHQRKQQRRLLHVKDVFVGQGAGL